MEGVTKGEGYTPLGDLDGFPPLCPDLERRRVHLEKERYYILGAVR